MVFPSTLKRFRWIKRISGREENHDSRKVSVSSLQTLHAAARVPSKSSEWWKESMEIWMLSLTGTSVMVSGSSVTLSLRHLWQVCLTRKALVTIPAKKEDLPIKAGGGVKWRFPDFVLLLTCESTPYCDSKKCSFASQLTAVLILWSKT